ncbi:unnamed protein product [Parnassius apollo]|uniref:(apollo) hypothetical protein n=1 Tax=Parnassius apollo TaxID=110799 RepID=A0A8S3W7U5_PARAO|nr:unnamed protein product [Parnassius apollo]
MVSSEEDNDAADNDENSREVLNNRLDFIQDIITGQGLYEILSGMNLIFISQSKFQPELKNNSFSIDVTMPAPEIHLPESTPPVDVSTPFSEIYSPASSPHRCPASCPQVDAPMPVPDVHLPVSSPLVHVPTPAPVIHAETQIMTPSSSNQPSISSSVPSYAQLQNRNWQWTNDIEDFDCPIFDRPMTVGKKYSQLA